MSETQGNKRLQYLALGLLSLSAIGFTAIVSVFPDTPFQRYFGGINPLLVVALMTVAGVVSLGALHTLGWFSIVSPGKSRQGLTISAIVATLFALTVVAADILIRFPEDLNVPPPQSLFFYPAVGYVVEVTFHAFPLALLLVLLNHFWKQRNPKSLVWLCILLVSVLEPILQLRLGYSGKPFSWVEGYVALHVFAFNLVELYIFRRYDFVSMYVFRFMYYLYWHIIWGHLRLQWLF
ncbi:MAG TPA: hypothetical protein VLG46_04945 [Anaerolineae bacterium]|nr:hypothetical protein [Anaerolineae bacterium]